MQHWIFLSPPRAGIPPERFHRRWQAVHAPIFARTPGLRGYVQNRPLRRFWPEVRYQACAESWFDDRQAETAAFGSGYYLGTVAPDEERFVDRAGSWSALVAGEEV